MTDEADDEDTDELPVPPARQAPSFGATEYIGDSVYICVENGMFKLFTDNGCGPTNVIYLDVTVYHAFLGYTKRVTDEIASNKPG